MRIRGGSHLSDRGRDPDLDGSRERDSCGIGFVADVRGRASRSILDAALEGLRRMQHRGAVAGDRRTGDGAGILMPIPPALVPGLWCGLATVFLRAGSARAAIEDACLTAGLDLGGWRRVPVRADALGAEARAAMPDIEQLVLVRPFGVDGDEAERRAYRALRRAQSVDGAYVASLSFRTVVYKALCAADQLASVFPDLGDPALAVRFAIFHQRFSTNTSPSWERAQPFRLLCHNGEINTIDGNIAAMRARAAEIGEVLDLGGSDSALLDNAFELLVRNGRDARHALQMLVPPAWQNDASLSGAERAFHDHHAALVEPWDGPAALVFTDGRIVGAALDRNGLRPLRYAVSAGGLVACASEAGAIPLPEGARVRRGRLGPGQMLVVDPAGFGLEEDAELKRRLASRFPYERWLRKTRRPLDSGETVEPFPDQLTKRQARAGFTREELSLLLRAAATSAHEPTSSMGDDTALPPLAGRSRPLFSYFRQRFAQVTNPPIDHLREREVTSLRTLLGARPLLLAVEPPDGTLLELESFFLFPSAVAALDAVHLSTAFTQDLRSACEGLAREAVAAAEAGAELLILDDAGDGPAMPSLLALGAVQVALVEAGLRTRCSLIVLSDEPRESHHFACLLGYGADAICPRLALETLAGLAAADKLGGDRPSPHQAQLRFQSAIEDGVLKAMARMGISDVASYRGAQLFDALGLAQEVIDLCFPGTASPLGGIRFAELEREAVGRSSAGQLENPGYVKWRKGGEPHATTPAVVEALQQAARTGEWDDYARFAALVDERTPLEPRDLLELADPVPVPLEEVEPVEAIVRRFSSGGMSHGALSAEAHETVAIAFNRLGARSNSGEGGEDRGRFRTERNSAVKQIASGRFGVTPEYAAFARELQIKMAQGSKPGEGGQLPGHKVTAEIARLRHTTPGVALISPPPHHDIYSIEDLAQLVFDLRQVNPRAEVSVKLVSEHGVGVVASGVAKALADVVHIAGADGGTGASPLSSIKNAGLPWEIGLAETQRELVATGLRGRIRVRIDGGLKTGRDVVLAGLLGADEVSFGTALLVAEGCLLVRSCHLDTCPVGIATQRPELRAKYTGTADAIVAYLVLVAEDVRRRLAALGLRSFDEAVGRTDLLRARTSQFELGGLLATRGTGYAGEAQLQSPGGELGDRLAADAAPALEEVRIVELEYGITTRDRAVGARLGGQIAHAFGDASPPGRVRARFEGSAGQSFGAFLSSGVELALTGEANDAVGKSMGGGRIVVRPPGGDTGDPVLLGNAALYGATGGELYCAGRAGERFGVRNSGAIAVVEGAGDHACEYMTGGTVAVLGPCGRNVGAGMSGGEAFVLGDVRLNDELVASAHLTSAEAAQLHELLRRHLRFTGSKRAAALLERWDESVRHFRRVTPHDAAAAAAGAAEGTAAG